MLNTLKLKFSLLVLVFLFFGVTLNADPIIIKGVDGSWIPVLAKSWNEKGGGVILEVVKDVDVAKIRTSLTELFPNMSIEIIGKTLFFSDTKVSSLFSILNGIDTGTSLSFIDKTLLQNQNSTIFKPQNTTKLTGDNVIESKIEAISFNPEKTSLFLDIKITQRAAKGVFHRYYGKQRIVVTFAMKESKIDSNNPRNLRFAPLLFLKKGNTLHFIPFRNKGDKLLTLTDFRVIK